MLINDYELGFTIALIEGEGSPIICRHKRKLPYTVPFTYDILMSMSNTHKELLEYFKDIVQSKSKVYKQTPNKKRKNNKPLYIMAIPPNELRVLLPLIKDKMVSKKRQIEILIQALEIMDERKHIHSSKRVLYRNKELEELFHENRRLNQRGVEGKWKQL